MRKLVVLLIIIFGYNLNYAQNKVFTFKDLVLFSKAKYGFVKKDGSINENYGDFGCLSDDKKLFEFNVGCGSAGDMITLIIKQNDSKPNFFDLYIPSGSTYYGKLNTKNEKVGDFFIVSENEIKGNIKLCLEKDAACCGEEGEKFILRKIK